jgi:hypothetical protein
VLEAESGDGVEKGEGFRSWEMGEVSGGVGRFAGMRVRDLGGVKIAPCPPKIRETRMGHPPR